MIIFIREKIIYNKSYAYLVTTRWDKRSKKVKQKVSKYLGKIIKLEKVRNIDFSDYFKEINDIEEYAKKTPLEDIIQNLVEIELYRCGFNKNENEKTNMSNGNIEIDISKINNINGVFSLNEGFLAKETLKQILRYEDIFKKSEKKYAFDFAALFVNAGLNIDKELFIYLYKRFFPQ